VRPGDVLVVRGELLKRMGPVMRVRVSARREGGLVARGVFTLREGGG
jgi:acyl-coenzyme A thioesterase PaaI-like protein